MMQYFNKMQQVIIIKLLLMSVYEQKIKYFKGREPNLLLNVIINKEEYELQVSGKHTIKDVIERYRRNDFISGDDVNAYPNQQLKQPINKSLTIQELIAANEGNRDITIVLANGPLKQIEARKLPDKPNISQQVFKLNQVKYDDSIIKSHRLMDSEQSKLIVVESEVKTQSEIVASTIIINELKEILQIINQKKQCPKKQWQQFVDLLKHHMQNLVPNYNRILQIIDKPQANDNYIQNFNSYEKEIYRKIKGLTRDPKEQILIPKEISERIIKYSKELQLSVSSKSESTRNGVLNLLDEFLSAIKVKNKQNLEALQQKSRNIKKLNQQIQRNGAQLQSLQQQISRLKSQLNEQKKFQSIILEQKQKQKEREIIQKSQLSNKKNLNNSNNNNTYKITSYFMGKPIFLKEVSFVVEEIQKYEKRKIDSFESLFSLRRNQINIDVVFSFLDLLRDRTARVLFLVGIDTDSLISVYSTTGTSRIGEARSLKQIGSKGSQKEVQVSSEERKCDAGPGFLLQINKSIKFESVSKEAIFIEHDEKFLNLACCFQVMMNMKKRLSIEYKSTRRKEIIDDKEQLKSLLGKGNKAQITHLEILRVFLCEEQVQ